MGKNNQQRRAAKRRRRAASSTAGHRGPDRAAEDLRAHAGEREPQGDARDVAARLLVAGADAAFGDNADEAALDRVVQSIVVRSASEPTALAAESATDWMLQLTGMLCEMVDNQWISRISCGVIEVPAGP